MRSALLELLACPHDGRDLWRDGARDDDTIVAGGSARPAGTVEIASDGAVKLHYAKRSV